VALTQRLDLRLGQSLVMTPQLQQAIKLLQMSSIELTAYVEEELERNPLLERDEKTEYAKPEREAREASDTDTVSALSADLPQEDRLRTLDTDLDNVFTHESRADSESRQAPGPSDSSWSSLKPSGGVSLDSEEMEFGSNLTRSETLAEHLTEQLHMVVLSPADRLIGQHLIGMVNEAGYLTGDIPGIAEALGTDMAHVESVLEILRGFDPPGVFAADLKECLALQLKDRDRLDPAMQRLLDHLPLVAKRDFAALKSLCKVDHDDIRDMVAELRSLNPKPGHAFGAEPVMPVVPDVFVRPSPDGAWLVELNSDTLPRVLVNNQYMAKVTRGTPRQEDKTFLAECHANAQWLIKSLDQRAKTILKVAREIVRQQDAFLVLGIQHLRPINLKTVADAIEMHESTVSRVTSNKYMETPRGIFEMKYFFTTAIASASATGEDHSAESVRHRIKDMIARETSTDILSDDTIVERLKADGVDIARRTVAKYRESLNIPSSVQRRREARSRL
jgi:RNA polymerase sigma-54 factor